MKEYRETTFKIVQQGDVKMAHNIGYMLLGNEDAVCFFIDPSDRAYVISYGYGNNDCPSISLVQSGVDLEQVEELTQIEFTDFPGWRVHADSGAKTIAIALVRDHLLDTPHLKPDAKGKDK